MPRPRRGGRLLGMGSILLRSSPAASGISANVVVCLNAPSLHGTEIKPYTITIQLQRPGANVLNIIRDLVPDHRVS